MAIKADQYERLREWFAFVFDHYESEGLSLTPESHPIACLDAIAVKYPARARQGLEMAINDTIELTQSWPQKRVQEIDDSLQANGLPTLSEIRARFSKEIRRVLKRGQINSDVEYYAVRNAVEMSDSEELGQLTQLIAAYETKAATARA